MIDKETVELALKRAFNFGQTYWQQADSEYTSHHKKADVTLESFKQLVKDTCQALEQSTEQEPEFTKHTVESTADWSEWVCPDPESYLMKCCDCGLVHEAQFGVVRYKSETEREDCDKVDDPNLQAVFRMRRHEAWEPEDTAHRVGGLPQSTEQEPVALHQFRSPFCSDWYDGVPDHSDGNGPYEVRTLYTQPQEAAQEYKRGYADAMNWKVQNHLEHLPVKGEKE